MTVLCRAAFLTAWYALKYIYWGCANTHAPSESETSARTLHLICYVSVLFNIGTLIRGAIPVVDFCGDGAKPGVFCACACACVCACACKYYGAHL